MHIRTRFSYLILQISSFCAAQLCKLRTSGTRPLSNSDDFLRNYVNCACLARFSYLALLLYGLRQFRVNGGMAWMVRSCNSSLSRVLSTTSACCRCRHGRSYPASAPCTPEVRKPVSPVAILSLGAATLRTSALRRDGSVVKKNHAIHIQTGGRRGLNGKYYCIESGIHCRREAGYLARPRWQAECLKQRDAREILTVGGKYIA